MSAEQLDLVGLTASIREWAGQLGFQQLGITDTELGEDAARLDAFLAAGYHGEWLIWPATAQCVRALKS